MQVIIQKINGMDIDVKKAKAYMAKSAHPNGFKATVYATIGRYPGDIKTCEALPSFLKKN